MLTVSELFSIYSESDAPVTEIAINPSEQWLTMITLITMAPIGTQIVGSPMCLRYQGK